VFLGLDPAIVTKRPTGPLYEFRAFRFSPSERILVRDGQRVLLAPKGLDTLLLLLENHGHIVGKDELLKRVWAGTFVEEHTVAQTVFTLRKALENTPEGQPYIETPATRLPLRRAGHRGQSGRFRNHHGNADQEFRTAKPSAPKQPASGRGGIGARGCGVFPGAASFPS
jgi:Transcriptional regulatory protein, C terminal